MSKKRKWNDSDVQFGFTCSETTEGLQKRQYMFCTIVFSNANLKLSKLREHFNNRHGGADVSDHDVKSLKAKRTHFESRGTLIKLGFVSADKQLLMASYHVVHTISEEVIKFIINYKNCSWKRSFKKS